MKAIVHGFWIGLVCVPSGYAVHYGLAAIGLVVMLQYVIP